MIKLIRGGVYYMEGRLVKESVAFMVDKKKQSAIKSTIAYNILNCHNSGNEESLKLKLDRLVSGWWSGEQVIKLASALGISEFKVPYTLVDTDLQTAKKFGCDCVSSRIAGIYPFICETTANSGDLILSSDDSVGCGALGAMAVVDDSTVLVKQFLNKPYEISRPQIVAVYLKGKPKKGVGAYDVALSILGATHKNKFLNDKILEFIGFGVKNVSVDFRMELDSLMCKTGCLASVWETDEAVNEYFKTRNRAHSFKSLRPADPAYYDCAVVVDLSRIEPMIADVNNHEYYLVKEFISNAGEITNGRYDNGKVKFKNCIIGGVGCESIAEVCDILKAGEVSAESSLSVRLKSLTAFKSLTDNGCISTLLGAGAAVNMLSVNNLIDGKYILDSRTIAATAANGGILVPANEFEYTKKYRKFNYDYSIYEKKVYRGFGKPQKDIQPDIEPLSEYIALPENVRIITVLQDEEGTQQDDELPEDETALYGIALKSSEECGYSIIEDAYSAVIAEEYASLKYRKSLINWGILPFVCRKFDFKSGDIISIENIRELIKSGCTAIPAKHISGGKTKNIMLDLPSMTEEEKKILLSGGLANYKN